MGKIGAPPVNKRKPEAEVDRLLLDRWSPRAFDPTPIPEKVVKSLFEAARWSPSCFNEQPWLFMYAVTPEDRALYLDLLVDQNKVWAANAPLLAFLFAHKRFAHNNRENFWNRFDCGAAWMSFSIQARLHGLYTHGMAGFHKERVCAALGVPEGDYEPVCAIAAGRYGDRDALPEKVKENESPNGRKPLARVALEGKYRTF
ncbi:MAG: nitroreductase family protein [Nitrospinae bacterium]|nr:nitroreductase family protein [Nitrospinota bacterium]